MKFVTKASITILSITLSLGSLTEVVKAGPLGSAIVGGVTNQALTDVTQKDCPNATGAGEDACVAAEADVTIHKDVTQAVNQEVQNTCQNATGAGEDACQGIDDVNTVKKHLSEQVDHLLFGSHPASPSPAAPTSGNTQN